MFHPPADERPVGGRPPPTYRPDQIEREAKESVQARLALASTIIWFAVAFGTIVALMSLGYGRRASLVLLVGFGALFIAGLPWLAYPRLVEGAIRQRRNRNQSALH
jgi:hypothetical protein